MPGLNSLRQMVGGLPRIFWYLWLGTLVNRVGIFVVPFLALFLTKHQGRTIQEATFVVSLYGLGSFASQLTSGYLTDLWGRRPTMLVSLFVTPVVLMALSSETSLIEIAATVLLLGFVTDLYRPASSAIIADVVLPQDRPRAFSLRYWAINLGAAVGLSLAGWLATQNYLLLFIGDALTTFGFGLITLFMIPETRPQRLESRPASEPINLLKRFTMQFAGEEALFRFAMLFALLYLVSASIYTQNDATMPLAMQANHLTEADFGTVIALNGLVIVLASLTINRILERRSRFLVMAGSAFLIGAGFGFYAISTTKLAYAIGVVVWTMGELIGSPIAPTILADLAPAHRRGFYQGILGASYGLAAFVGPALGGAIYSHLGETTLWLLCLAAGTLTALGHYLVIRPLHERLKHTADHTAENVREIETTS